MHRVTAPECQRIVQVASDVLHHDRGGGEDHMEVAQNSLNVIHSKVNMTLSVKPFGCMPSSGVSDGVQSAITELYPEAIFLPIETTGDGAVNVYSRVQMMLFKARKAARKELDDVLAAYDMSEDQARSVIAKVPGLAHALVAAPHRHASTAANTAELAGSIRHPVKGFRRWWAHRNYKPEERLAKHLASRANLGVPTAARATSG